MGFGVKKALLQPPFYEINMISFIINESEWMNDDG
jgi:hypothetical protein